MQRRGRSGRKHCDEQAPSKGSGARNVVGLPLLHGQFDRGRWLQDLSRIKTRRAPSLPNWLLFPSNFPTRAQQTRQHSCPTSYQPLPDLPLLLLAPSCCSHPSWPRCPLIRHDSTCLSPSRSCSLPQATPTPWKTCSITPQRIICCSAAIILQLGFSSPQGSHLPQGLWHTGAPVVALITPDSSHYLLLNAPRIDCPGYAPD